MPDVVAVHPAGERERRPRLFAALEQAFGVSFDDMRWGAAENVRGMIVFRDSSAQGEPSLTGVPTLVLGTGAGGQVTSMTRNHAVSVEFGSSAKLDARLRGRRGVERGARQLEPVTATAADEVLASADGRPVWTTRGTSEARVDFASLVPEELDERHSLADRLQRTTFLSLLPVVHFLREITGYSSWDRPRLRASIIFDDPNLHWRSYGFLHFQRLVAHAKEHRYHAGMATIPLDGWLVHPATARVFRDEAAWLSLLMHGNNHVFRELTPEDGSGVVQTLAEALRRAASLERRASVKVARVMVPPHGDYSEAILEPLRDLRFEALCAVFPQAWWPKRPPSERLLGPWPPADLSRAGFPVLRRYRLDELRSPDDLVLTAFLDQPIILYGHHEDLADGLHPLARAAEQVGRLGHVTWGPLDAISRSNFFTRREGDLLRVEVYARHIRFCVPAGVERVVVEVRKPFESSGEESVVCGASRAPLAETATGFCSEPLAIEGPRDVEIRLASRVAIDPSAVPPPPWRPQPLVRRVLTETRDRAWPVIRRVGAEPLLRRVQASYHRAIGAR